MNYQKVLEDHLILSRRLFGPELGTRMVLGNHDFNTHYLASCIGASLIYYFPYDPASGPVAVALHGDYLDSIQTELLSERLQHRATYRFGPMVKQVVYDLEGLPAKIMGGYRTPDPIGVAQPASLGKSGHIDERPWKEELAQSRFNVQAAGDPRRPGAPVRAIFPRQRTTLAIVNDQTGWDLRLVVIGHTHMARIVLDERSATDGGSQKGILCTRGLWSLAGRRLPRWEGRS